MSKKYKITLKVHPMVFRYIDNNFQCIRGVYDVTYSKYYPLVSSMLCQNNTRLPSKVRPSYNLYRVVSIYITEYDFYHYGYSVCELQQFRFSKLLRSLIIDDMCRRIAMLRAAFNVPLTKAIQEMLDCNMMEPDELKPDTLRKIYKRNYSDVELKYSEFFQNCVTDYGANDIIFEKKKYGPFVPTTKNTSNIWRI